MTTLSQLVDRLIMETRRPDQRANIEQAINLTIRELHSDEQTGAAVTYGANLQEAVVYADADNGHVWQIPQPHLFQVLIACAYPNRGLTVRDRNPGAAIALRHEINGDVYKYRSGDSYVFSGYGGIGEPILLAWYEMPKRLSYQKPSDRLVVWDSDNEEYVFAPSVVTDEDKQRALRNATNWILARHDALVSAGARAKLYVDMKDQERARLAYSLYQNLRPGFRTAEGQDYSPVYVE